MIQYSYEGYVVMERPKPDKPVSGRTNTGTHIKGKPRFRINPGYNSSPYQPLTTNVGGGGGGGGNSRR